MQYIPFLRLKAVVILTAFIVSITHVSADNVPNDLASSNEESLKWAKVENLLSPSVEGERIDWLEVARKLSEFIKNNPRSKHHKQARKMIVQAELFASLEGKQHGRKLDVLVNELVSDESIDELDRYQIRALYKEVKLAKREVGDRSVFIEQKTRDAKDLISEFPNQESGYRYLIAVARASDKAQRRKLLREIVNNPKTPGAAGEEAKRRLDMLDLEGTALDLPGIDESGYSGLPLVIYTWSIDEAPPQILKIGKELIGKVNFVGICLNESNQDIGRIITEEGYPGVHYFDGLNHEISDSLFLSEAKNVIFVDASGIITDVNGVEGLNEKLAIAGGFHEQYKNIVEMGGVK